MISDKKVFYRFQFWFSLVVSAFLKMKSLIGGLKLWSSAQNSSEFFGQIKLD